MLIITFSFIFIILTLVYYFKNYRDYDSNKALFYEIYLDLENTPKARIFNTFLLIRRLAFVMIVIFLNSFGFETVFSALLIVQLIYLWQTVVIPKFE